MASVQEWIASRIPPVSAAELGVFRVLLGAALAWILWDMRLPAEPFPPELHLRAHPLADWPWVHALAARPQAVAWVQHIIVGLAVIFAAGLMTRLAFAALVGGVGLWLMIRLQHTGTHDWMPLFVTLCACLPVRWGDGFSLDAMFRRLRQRTGSDPTRRSQYGFALWVPGLVFGAAMAGAGAAKLTQSGLAWITNGSVKYHFIVDASNAPTTWGLWVASHPVAAVLLSAGAILVECTLVLAVLVPSRLGRLPFALMGLGLLGGFYAFQNEVWKPWWLLFLAFFVPWPSLVRVLSGRRRGAAPSTDRRLAPLQILAIVVVLGLQIGASVRRVELAPILSDYPMYSTTYASIEEFERRNAMPAVYHFAVQFAEGDQAPASEVFDELRLDEPVRDAYLAVVERRALEERTRATIQQVATRASAHYGRPVTAIIVLIDQRGFDWKTGRFGWLAIRKPVHTFAVDE